MFAIGQGNKVGLLCSFEGFTKANGIKFWVKNGCWNGIIYPNGKLYVNQTRETSTKNAKIIWEGEIPRDLGDYNKAIFWLEEKLESGEISRGRDLFKLQKEPIKIFIEETSSDKTKKMHVIDIKSHKHQSQVSIKAFLHNMMSSAWLGIRDESFTLIDSLKDFSLRFHTKIEYQSLSEFYKAVGYPRKKKAKI